MIPTENVVLFALEVVVQSCCLVSHGAETRATAGHLSRGARFHRWHVVGRFLLFGVCVLREECDCYFGAVKLVGCDFARAVFRLLRGTNACCTKFTLCIKNIEKRHHLFCWLVIGVICHWS